MILYIIWECAAYVTLPFLGTYQISELGFPLTLVATISMASSLLQIPISMFFGQYSIKHSFASIMGKSFPFAIIAFGMLVFSNEKNGIFLYSAYLLFQIIYQNMHNISYQNLIYNIVPFNQRISAVAIKPWRSERRHS